MTPRTTRALVLKVLPFRESSCILYLFTEAYGLIHCIAKGLRSRKAGKETMVERGVLIEVVAYVRQHRDLHTAGAVSVAECFPRIRAGLVKSALRDAAFEAVLAGIKVSDPHPELFALFEKFMGHLNCATVDECHPFALWLFYYRLCQYLGVGAAFEKCVSCGQPVSGDAVLSMERGGLVCSACSPSPAASRILPADAISYLRCGRPKPCDMRNSLSKSPGRRVTRLLADYCRYHLDIAGDFKSLAFLDEMTDR